MPHHEITLHLPTRAPFDVDAMLAYLAAHAVPGRDHVDVTHGGCSSHALDLPGGTGCATVAWHEVPRGEHQRTPMVDIPVTFTLPTHSDQEFAIRIVRRMFDLDADPERISAALCADPRLAPLIATRPGLRLPRARHPHEFALGTVLGQQVSIAAARTVQGRLAAQFGRACGDDSAAPGCFSAPDLTAIAAYTPERIREALRITNARAATVHGLATALMNGLDISFDADQLRSRAELVALRGIGPWTVEIVALRALCDDDAYPAGDLILRRALKVEKPRDAEAAAAAWSPYRGYATQHLWADFLATHATGGTRFD